MFQGLKQNVLKDSYDNLTELFSDVSRAALLAFFGLASIVFVVGLGLAAVSLLS